jgi:hypothetical protein
MIEFGAARVSVSGISLSGHLGERGNADVPSVSIVESLPLVADGGCSVKTIGYDSARG